MKQLLFVLTALVLAILPGKAQTSLVATLSHEGNITTFYSGNALRDAYAAATDGDVITLSAGAFQLPSAFFEKKISVIGAGMMPNNAPTIITGNVDIRIQETEENSKFNLVFEGLEFTGVFIANNLTDGQFLKCYFSDIVIPGSKDLKNVKFIHCISDKTELDSQDVTFINCILSECRFGAYGYALLNLQHCIINKTEESYYKNIFYTNLKDCIIIDSIKDSFLSTQTTASGCVYVGPSTIFFDNCKSTTNRSFPEGTEVFKEGSAFYELTDEAAQWLGDDGTQVGIHGGSLPFDPIPSTPQITKFNVSPKTTADGKLSVEIEVKAN